MNIQTYRQLIYSSGFANERAARKERLRLEGYGMPIILRSPLKNSDDLIRMIHMVYAWMPKMLRSFNENVKGIDLRRLLQLAKQARLGHINLEKEDQLFINLAKLTNNHMVGASKILAILNHSVYPIFDSRVVLSWNAFFAQRPQLNINKLRSHRVDQHKAMIKNYRYYKDTLQLWANHIHRNIRDIEFLFWRAKLKEA